MKDSNAKLIELVTQLSIDLCNFLKISIESYVFKLIPKVVENLGNSEVFLYLC